MEYDVTRPTLGAEALITVIDVVDENHGERFKASSRLGRIKKGVIS
jgi:hypothetical protein